MAQLDQRDRAKERFWRRMLRLWRQRRPRMAVPEFCAAYGLTEASFCAWQRTIAERDRLPRPAPRRPKVRPTPRADDTPAEEQPLFVPLVVPPLAAATNTATALELVHDSGRIVRVPPGFDAATLRQLLTVLEEPSC